MDTLVELFRYTQRLQSYPYINHKRLLLIPELYDDFAHFITGQTIMSITDDRELLMPQSLYFAWINKIVTRGFDTEIDLKKYISLICPECSLPFVLPFDCDDSRCPVCSSKNPMEIKQIYIKKHEHKGSLLN